MKKNWINIYQQLATLLNDFYITNQEKSGEILYEYLMESKYKDEFIELNPWAVKFEELWNVKSFDPIHLFASFNSWKIPLKKRISKIRLYIKILSGQSLELDNSNDLDIFKYFPHIQITKVVSARDVDSQKIIWKLFNQTYNSNISPSQFDLSLKQYGIGFPSLTIFMFWVNPHKYLPLDKNTLTLIIKYNKNYFIQENYKSYSDLIENNFNISGNLYINLTHYAIEKNSMDGFSKKEKEEITLYLKDIYSINKENYNTNINNTENKFINSHNFNIFAIKPLSKCASTYRKKLKNTIYHLNSIYKVNEKNNQIRYFPENDISIYSENELNININAIVGENGSGKSALVELFLLAINNLTRVYDTEELTNLKFTSEKLAVEIFFSCGSIYRVSIIDTEISIYKYYSINEKNLFEGQKIENVDFKLNDMFYTVYKNYSIYSLNSNNKGFDCLEQLFHKNDAYQTPIVIEPMRKQGNIDVNSLSFLTKNRLIARLLSPFEGDVNKFRNISKSKHITDIKLIVNEAKMIKINSQLQNFEYKDVYKKIFNYYFNNESFQETLNDNSPISLTKRYIVYKVVNIYMTYADLFNEFDIHTELIPYIKKLEETNSHIMYKLKQAINFTKYKELRDFFIPNKKLNVIDLSNKLELFNYQKNEKFDFVLPPAIFEAEFFIFDEETKTPNIPFDTLSSGEKQMIYSINSILYQILNVDSVKIMNSNLYSFNRINIILDEIELYFHPEMQRLFIDNLLFFIKNISAFEKINELNIILVTHSPFILSDIVSDNVLPLSQKEQKLPTFATNIHELLSSSFFLNSTTGKFASKEINKIFKFHETIMKENNLLEIEKVKSDYINKKKKYHYIVKNIGEQYIKSILENNLIDIEKKFNTSTYIQEKIIILEEEINNLRKKIND